MQLFRTTCTNDWKGRPSHKLVLIATSDDRNWLIQAMADDVAKWQAADLASMQESWDEALEADENLEEQRPTQWAAKNMRFEMQRPLNEDMREFSEVIGDGEFSTTVYHILD